MLLSIPPWNDFINWMHCTVCERDWWCDYCDMNEAAHGPTLRRAESLGHVMALFATIPFLKAIYARLNKTLRNLLPCRDPSVGSYWRSSRKNHVSSNQAHAAQQMHMGRERVKKMHSLHRLLVFLYAILICLIRTACSACARWLVNWMVGRFVG